MSLALPILIGLLVFAVLIIADMIHPMLCAGLLFMFYMWSLIAFDLSILQKIFYPIGILFYIAVRGNLGKDLQTNSDRMDVNGAKPQGVVTGLKYHMLSIFIGLGMLFIMYLMTASKGQFLGVAPLAITSSGFSAWITAQFAPSISIALAFIENRMFITWLSALLLAQPALTAALAFVPLLMPLAMILPIAIVAVTFGLFHIVAYAIVWKLIWWAAAIMILWIISYYLTGRDTTAMDTAHGGWNGWLTMKESLSIAL